MASSANGSSGVTPATEVIPAVKRSDFPKDFVFGAATSAYQIEGGYDADGKGPSVWDKYTNTRPDRFADGRNGNIAADQYHLYEEDVKLLKKTGLDAYRFSISWPRILPGGHLSAGINKAGVKYYNNLIDALLAEGIEPYVTIFHWDIPLALEQEYGGFLSDSILDDFVDFAEVCFWEFGDRVKNWITINEAWTYTVNSYVYGGFSQARGATDPNDHGSLHHYKGISKPVACTQGDPGTEPYIVAHNLILGHAAIVDLYRKQFQPFQGGKIGITNNINWHVPLQNNEDDKAAALRAVDFMLGWFIHPIVHGDYPKSMRDRVGDRLPRFDEDQKKTVQGSYDFLGINYYTTYYAYNTPRTAGAKPNYTTDQEITSTPLRNGVAISTQAGSSWLYVVPSGLYELLVYLQREYRNPIIYITENGYDEKSDPGNTLADARFDEARIKYHNDHLWYLKKALADYRIHVKSYFIWSFADNFEWLEGYTVRFGIYYVDFVSGKLTRYPKRSALWWTNFLTQKRIKDSTD